MAGRIVGILLIGALLIVLAGSLLGFFSLSRNVANRTRVENSLRVLGFYGLQHATKPGDAIDARPVEFFPPATLATCAKNPEERLNWYAWALHALDRTTGERIRQGVESPLFLQWQTLDTKTPWNQGANQQVARQRPKAIVDFPWKKMEKPADYPATPFLANGGYQWPGQAHEPGTFQLEVKTPYTDIADGLSQTITLYEALNSGPWLQGGAGSFRIWEEPFVGQSWSQIGLGRCLSSGFYASFADGSVRFTTVNIEPRLIAPLFGAADGARLTIED